MKRILAFSIIIVMLAYSICWSKIINVPMDWATVHQGIYYSVDGDTVLVHPGSYLGSHNTEGHDILLTSLYSFTGDSTYIESTILEADSVYCALIVNSHCRIIGFTIQNGAGTYDSAGGITCLQNSDSSVIAHNIIKNNFSLYRYGVGGVKIGDDISEDLLITVRDNKIINNRSFDTPHGFRNGGGILISCRSGPRIINNLIADNSTGRRAAGIRAYHCDVLIDSNTFCGNSSYYGGGIYCSYGSPMITNNIFYDNSGFYAAGVYCTGGSPIIVNNNIYDNSATYGGGMHFHNYSTAIVSNNIVFNNDANYGGAMTIYSGDIQINGNIFDSNIAHRYGGAINLYSTSKVQIIDNRISYNSAEMNGGAIYSASDSNQYIVGNVINNNTSLFGGGIYCKSKDMIIGNEIYDNSSPFGAGIYCAIFNPLISGNRIYDNDAIMRGAGVYCADSALL
jgi:predicted outer membrane repeat protein